MSRRKDITCPKCQKSGKPLWIRKGPHIGIYCQCGKWLAWKKQNWAEKGYFGSDNAAKGIAA